MKRRKPRYAKITQVAVHTTAILILFTAVQTAAQGGII